MNLYSHLMSFKKPFRAVPIAIGSHYREKQRRSDRNAALKFLGLAAVTGAIGGGGSMLLSPEKGAAFKPVAVQAGIMRKREPRAGDSWGGCDDARAAGTAPIYSAEPGYRKEMDGDGDGIACEPYR